MTSVEIPSNMAYGGHGQFVPSQPVIAAPALSWLDLAADRFDRWISPRIVYYHSITDPKTPILTLLFLISHHTNQASNYYTISYDLLAGKLIALFCLSIKLPGAQSIKCISPYLLFLAVKTNIS